MPLTLILAELVGHVVLLLWGMRMVHSGIVRAYGSGLRRVLGAGLKNRFSALLAGMMVTAVLQSSTATAIMTTSFAAGGMVDLMPALAVMLGANVGTTLIVKALSFDISWVSPILLAAGYLSFKWGGKSRIHDLGRVGIGLGLMLLALHLLVATIQPAERAPVLHDLLAALTHEPVLDLLLAAVLTWAAHSSVAVMLLVVSLAGAGLLTPVAALAFVLGANLGSTVPPVLAALGPNPATRRLPLGNLAIRAIGCLVALPLLQPIAHMLAGFESDAGRQAVDFHIGFNIVLALVFIGLLDPVANLLRRALPAKREATDAGCPQYLDEAALETPYLALANAAREMLRMGDMVEAMLQKAFEALTADRRKPVFEIIRIGKKLDRLQDAVKSYLARIGFETLSDDDARRCRDLLAFAVNLGHAGDVIEHNLAETIGRKIRHRLVFAPEDMSDITTLQRCVLDNLRLALSALISEDERSARELLIGKGRVADLERLATQNHLQRLGNGRTGSTEASSLDLAVLRDLRRVNSHISTPAYAVLELAGRPRLQTPEAQDA